MKCPWCGKEVTTEEYSHHLTICPKYKERPGYERGGIIPPSEIVYHRIRQEEFASEFLDSCIQKTRELYGLTEDMVKQLIKDMGYNPSGNDRKERPPWTRVPEEKVPTVPLLTVPALRKLFGEMERYIGEEDFEELLKVGMEALMNVGLLYRDATIYREPSRETYRFINHVYNNLAITLLSAYRNNWADASKFLGYSKGFLLSL